MKRTTERNFKLGEKKSTEHERSDCRKGEMKREGNLAKVQKTNDGGFLRLANKEQERTRSENICPKVQLFLFSVHRKKFGNSFPFRFFLPLCFLLVRWFFGFGDG